MRRYSSVDHNDDADAPIERRQRRALRLQSAIQSGISTGAIVVGITSVVLMFSNEAFPAFTLSPVVVGLMGLITGSLGICMARRKSPDSGKGVNKNLEFIHYLLNVLTATLSSIGTVYSCISGALCSGMKLVTSHGNSDIIQFCKPNTEVSSVFAFVDGAMCIVVGIWSMRGVCFVCHYGTKCGLNYAAEE